MAKQLEKIKKKQKIQNIIKWVFICLGWTTLLACFISLLVIGIKGCSNKKQQANAQEVHRDQLQNRLNLDYEDYNQVYFSRFYGDTNISSEALRDIAVYLGYSDTYSTAQPQVVLNDYNYTSAYNSNGEFLELVRVQVVLRTGLNSIGGVYSYRLESVTLYSYDDNITVCSTQTHGYLSGDSVVNFRYNGSIVLKDNSDNRSLLKIALLDPFYSFEDFNPLTITFNEQINYNAPVGYGYTEAYVPVSSSLIYYMKTYSMGVFMSGGQIFDTITFTYAQTGAVSMYVGGSTQPELVPSGNYYFAWATYENSTTNRVVTVNRRAYENYKDGSGFTNAVLNESYWVSNSYRQITFLEPISESNVTELTKLNNTSSLINGGISYGGDIGGVFNLLGSAFTSWLGIFAIQVLPGLSLGVFIFLPAIVTIIILVFKAVKK